MQWCNQRWQTAAHLATSSSRERRSRPVRPAARAFVAPIIALA
jgi:hypothetical protein